MFYPGSLLSYELEPSGLYRHRRGLGLHRVGYNGRRSTYPYRKLAFHAKESPIRTRDEVFNLVSSQSRSLADGDSLAIRTPPNLGLPQ